MNFTQINIKDIQMRRWKKLKQKPRSTEVDGKDNCDLLPKIWRQLDGHFEDLKCYFLFSYKDVFFLISWNAPKYILIEWTTKSDKLGNIAIINSRTVIANFECEMQIIHFWTIWHATGTN